MKKGILGFVVGAVAGYTGRSIMDNKLKVAKEEKVDKFKSYYNMLNQWLALKQENKSLAEYFVTNHYKTIAIYGMGEMGNRLYEELKDTDIKIKYAIDQNPAGAFAEIDIVGSDDVLEEVDAVIVTAIFAFDKIEKMLTAKLECPIISLDDVVFDL